ncbi:sulfatase [Citrobacter farmeri]|uniref:sulfatase family protein n=1 Tax=Citrobacter farmeri TaxID=67824 RepID=UPI0019056FBE|nr:sulfatase [Citrobacter farmeri]MBJ9164590.1 sulfatase [Citrobacter farmeri]
MNRKDFLKGLFGFSMVSLLPFAVGAKKKDSANFKGRLNLLFITADDLDYSVPGFMGGMKGLTPNLDDLASRSHIFTNNRTVAAICMPSRQSLMSGLIPHRNGGEGFIPMKKGTQTLASILKKEGWYTAAIHKIDHMQPISSFPWDFSISGSGRNTAIHSEGFKVAVKEAQSQSRPFFINCNINDPHRPFYGTPEGLEKDHGNIGVFSIKKEITAEEVTIPPNLEDLPDIRKEIAQYWNSAQRMDIAIGNILQALDETGEAKRTVVIFCSDHGMPFPFAKATCYEHGTRAPVLVSLPGMQHSERHTNLTTHTDVMPTALEILGIQAPTDLDGRSLLPILRNKTMSEPEFIFTYINQTASGMAYPTRAVHDHRYTLIFSPWSDGELKLKVDGMLGLTFAAMEKSAQKDRRIAQRVKQLTEGTPLAFYDLKMDPGQRDNLIDIPEHKGMIEKMKQALLNEMKRTNDPQMDNFVKFLAGEKTSVAQDPERYRLKRGHGYYF